MNVWWWGEIKIKKEHGLKIDWARKFVAEYINRNEHGGLLLAVFTS